MLYFATTIPHISLPPPSLLSSENPFPPGLVEKESSPGAAPSRVAPSASPPTRRVSPPIIVIPKGGKSCGGKRTRAQTRKKFAPRTSLPKRGTVYSHAFRAVEANPRNHNNTVAVRSAQDDGNKWETGRARSKVDRRVRQGGEESRKHCYHKTR